MNATSALKLRSNTIKIDNPITCMEAIKNGMDANEAVKKFTGRYGRTTADQGIVKSIDPRKE